MSRLFRPFVAMAMAFALAAGAVIAADTPVPSPPQVPGTAHILVDMKGEELVVTHTDG